MPVLLSTSPSRWVTHRSLFVPIRSACTAATSTKSPSEQSAYLGWILVRNHWITPAQLEEALQMQQMTGTRLGDLLMQRSLLTSEQLENALKEQFWRRNGYWII